VTQEFWRDRKLSPPDKYANFSGADSGQLGRFWEPIGKGEVLVKGTKGVAILPELSPRPGEAVLERDRYSPFYNSELDRMLRDKGIETLIIGGYSTNFCCDSTARHANFRDYHVVVLEDGTAPIALEEAGGKIITSEQAGSFAPPPAPGNAA
jgi:ureidoacrylate peracid hydrolase